MQGVLDVVRRAAVKLALAARQLVDLRERAFDKARRAAEECNRPHPEDGARAARDDGDGHARDVADANTRSRRDAEGLERADSLFARPFRADAFRQHAQHLGEHAELDEFRREREPDAAADEHDDEHVRPENVVDGIDETAENFHEITAFARKIYA